MSLKASKPGTPVYCLDCGHVFSQDPCFEVTCPDCKAPPNQYCRRPSGHSGPFVDFHGERDLQAAREGHYDHQCTKPLPARPPEKSMKKIVRAKDIPDDEVARMAVAMGWTSHPSHLMIAIRQKYKCSDAVAGKVYSRLTDKGIIAQIQGTRRQVAHRDSGMYGGGACVNQGLAHWITPDMDPENLYTDGVYTNEEYWQHRADPL